MSGHNTLLRKITLWDVCNVASHGDHLLSIYRSISCYGQPTPTDTASSSCPHIRRRPNSFRQPWGYPPGSQTYRSTHGTLARPTMAHRHQKRPYATSAHAKTLKPCELLHRTETTPTCHTVILQNLLQQHTRQTPCAPLQLFSTKKFVLQPRISLSFFHVQPFITSAQYFRDARPLYPTTAIFPLTTPYRHSRPLHNELQLYQIITRKNDET